MATKKYTTKKGDMWDTIALDTLGKEMYANQLIEANLRHSKVVIFDAGIELIIPSISTTNNTADLPPWKR